MEPHILTGRLIYGALFVRRKGDDIMANISVRVDDNVKKQAEHICSELGMSLSTATTLFYKKMINYGGIPFELNWRRLS